MCCSPGVRKAALLFFFFFNDTATTEIYTLSLHDALPISAWTTAVAARPAIGAWSGEVSSGPIRGVTAKRQDRKSTRLNSSHGYISYAVFCLKKKKKSFTILLLAYSRCIVAHILAVLDKSP